MAESKGGMLAKRLQKQYARTKTKVLQNLGKAEKTKDDDFDMHVNNFHKQQQDAHRLNKELKKYIECAKEMSNASKAFYEALEDIYESEWVDAPVIRECGRSLELLWVDYIQKLNDHVLNPLNQYMGSFQESKTKISKRGRKLVDYDNSKHHLDGLMSSKKKDENKIVKAQEEMNECRAIFEEYNNELHEELPNLYDRRISVYANNFCQLYNAECVFHTESGKLKTQVLESMEKLQSEFDAGTYRVKRSPVHGSHANSGASQDSSPASTSPSLTKFYNVNIPDGDHPGDSDSNAASLNEEQHSEGTESDSTPVEKDEAKESRRSSDIKRTSDISRDKARESADDHRYEPVEIGNKYDEEDENRRPNSLDQDSDDQKTEGQSANTTANETSQETSVYVMAEETSDHEEEEDNYQVPSSNKPVIVLPNGVLYAVKVTHNYVADDDDELTLETGETVFVVPFSDPEEQDEGWLMGYKKGQEDKVGVFPENFTEKF